MMYANEMIEARRTPELRSLSQRAQADTVRVLIHRLYELKGVEPLERDVNICTEDIVLEVGRRYPHITTGEISLAFKYGLAENFGKDTRLVGSNFLLWLERYMTHPERLDAIKGATAAQTAQHTALLSEADRDTRHAEFIQNAPRKEWERFKETGKLDINTDGYAAAIFDALVERGKIHASEATIAAAVAQARTELENEARRGSTGIRSLLNINNGEEARTKRILLETYFKTLRGRGIELS